LVRMELSAVWTRHDSTGSLSVGGCVSDRLFLLWRAGSHADDVQRYLLRVGERRQTESREQGKPQFVLVGAGKREEGNRWKVRGRRKMEEMHEMQLDRERWSRFWFGGEHGISCQWLSPAARTGPASAMFPHVLNPLFLGGLSRLLRCSRSSGGLRCFLSAMQSIPGGLEGVGFPGTEEDDGRASIVIFEAAQIWTKSRKSCEGAAQALSPP
jgi:hypothetical protein